MADLRNSELSGDRASRDHWLVRPRTIRRLWAGFACVLALTLVAQAVIPIKSHSVRADWPGFAAAFGLLACVAMILLARALGVLLKRKDGYYDA